MSPTSYLTVSFLLSAACLAQGVYQASQIDGALNNLYRKISRYDKFHHIPNAAFETEIKSLLEYFVGDDINSALSECSIGCFHGAADTAEARLQSSVKWLLHRHLPLLSAKSSPPLTSAFVSKLIQSEESDRIEFGAVLTMFWPNEGEQAELLLQLLKGCFSEGLSDDLSVRLGYYVEQTIGVASPETLLKPLKLVYDRYLSQAFADGQKAARNARDVPRRLIWDRLLARGDPYQVADLSKLASAEMSAWEWSYVFRSGIYARFLPHRGWFFSHPNGHEIEMEVVIPMIDKKTVEYELVELISIALSDGLTQDNIRDWFEGKQQQLKSDHRTILEALDTLRSNYREHFDQHLNEYFNRQQSQSQGLPSNE